MRYFYRLRKDLDNVVEKHLKEGMTEQHVLQTLINMHEYRLMQLSIKQNKSKKE